MHLESSQQKGKEHSHSFAKEKGAGALVPCGRAALAVTGAGGGALWVGPALQGPALVLTGVVQSQEHYVALLSHLLPIRLCWGGDCRAGIFGSR